MRIYLAGPYSWQEKLNGYAKRLEIRGHKITSTWLLSEIDDNHPLDDDAKQMLAIQDLQDIDAADVFVAFMANESKHHRGGRHVEYGYALGLAETRRMDTIVIGESENIFYSVFRHRFSSWDAFLANVPNIKDEPTEHVRADDRTCDNCERQGNCPGAIDHECYTSGTRINWIPKVSNE